MSADGTLGVVVLGATGSIGTNTIDVIARHPDRYRVVGLTAGHNVEAMHRLCERFQPEVVAMADPDATRQLCERLGTSSCRTTILDGEGALDEVARIGAADVVMSAITGAAGLAPTLAAVRASKRVLLANKESLVMTGDLMIDEVSQSGATLLPVDSEHNALFQCMPQTTSGVEKRGVCGVVLTASGGPFRDWSPEQLEVATPAQALAHPRWTMGQKVSIDSASLMNKGLEVIEASHFFALDESDIEVVVHPQSTVHSLVRYTDGSLLAQLGEADMRIPIAHALAWPDRVDSGARALDLVALARLDFEQPDTERFPALRLAREAARSGGTAPAILNAANEIAVSAFLARRIGFRTICDVIDHTMGVLTVCAADTLDTVLEADRLARRVAEDYIGASI